GRGGRARRPRPRPPTLVRRRQHRRALGQQIVDARRQRVVEGDQVVVEVGAEQLGRALDRCEANACGRHPVVSSQTDSFRMAARSLSMGECAHCTRRRTLMATVLFIVKATIRKDQEAAFNRWYNEEHVPQFLQWKGAVSARRYRAILGEDTYQYMAVYELVNEANFRALMDSEHMKPLRAEYDTHF